MKRFVLTGDAVPLEEQVNTKNRNSLMPLVDNQPAVTALITNVQSVYI